MSALLIKDLVVGSYFLQYENDSSSKINERLCRVFEIEQQEDGEVVAKAFSYKDGGYYFAAEYRTVASNQTGVKITPISQAHAYEWINRFQVAEKLIKAVAEAKAALDKASMQLSQFNQYLIGEEQNLIEG